MEDAGKRKIDRACLFPQTQLSKKNKLKFETNLKSFSIVLYCNNLSFHFSDCFMSDMCIRGTSDTPGQGGEEGGGAGGD